MNRFDIIDKFKLLDLQVTEDLDRIKEQFERFAPKYERMTCNADIQRAYNAKNWFKKVSDLKDPQQLHELIKEYKEFIRNRVQILTEFYGEGKKKVLKETFKGIFKIIIDEYECDESIAISAILKVVEICETNGKQLSFQIKRSTKPAKLNIDNQR